MIGLQFCSSGLLTEDGQHASEHCLEKKFHYRVQSKQHIHFHRWRLEEAQEIEMPGLGQRKPKLTSDFI